MALPQERAAALLLAALEHNNPDLAEYPDAYLRWLAASLSAAIAAREAQQPSFASRVRSLCFNMKSTTSCAGSYVRGSHLLPERLDTG